MNEKDKKKPFLSIFEEVSKKNGHPFPGIHEEEEEFEFEDERTELTDELDHEVLMHRDAHFGGDFQVMYAYYQDEKIGVHSEIELDRIAYLAEVEKQLGQDLASVILTGPEAELVARSRRAYENIKEIYELDEEEEKSPFPRLIADLILTENSEPESEIEAIVAHGTNIVPELLEIVQSEEAFDPLFPGYGYAPYLAIICLGLIKDDSAVVPLFETLGRDILFDEEIVVETLGEIGAPARDFLLGIITGRPITKDTINAAFALTVFANQEEVALACFKQLKDPDVYNHPLLRAYLLFNCEILPESEKQNLSKMVHDKDLPADFRDEIENMIREWE